MSGYPREPPEYWEDGNDPEPSWEDNWLEEVDKIWPDHLKGYSEGFQQELATHCIDLDIKPEQLSVAVVILVFGSCYSTPGLPRTAPDGIRNR